MKTKEQVLAISSLTAVQRQRAIDYFDAQERFHNPLQINANSEAEVKKVLNQMQERYEKRKATEKKRREKKEAEAAQIREVVNLIKEANGLGIKTEEVIATIKQQLKDKINEPILARIEALKRQLV